MDYLIAMGGGVLAGLLAGIVATAFGLNDFYRGGVVAMWTLIVIVLLLQ